MRKFIRNVYTLGIIFALIAGLNAYVGMLHVNAPVRRELERKMEAELDFLIEDLWSTFTSLEKTLEVAGYYVGMESDQEKITRFLEDLEQQNPSYMTIYRGTPDDEILARWYTKAVGDGGVTYTTNYADARIITVSKPVFGPQESLLAVVAIDLSLADMFGSPDRGFFFLADDSTILASYGHAQLDSSLFAEPEGMMEFTLDNTPGYLRWSTIGESGLVVAIFQQNRDLGIRREQNRTVLGVAVLSLIVGSAAVFWFLRLHIVLPMRELGRDLMLISLDRDSSYRLPVGKDNSLGVFRQALNARLDKAREHYEHVNQQRKDLSDAYNQLMEQEQMLQNQYAQILENEEKIRFMAEYDALTGLRNRRMFQEELQETLDQGLSGAVFLMDIDDFKNINDTQGHSFGDHILQAVAQLLEQEVAPTATVYRFGGDEFVVIVRHEFASERVQVYVDRVSEKLAAMTLEGGRRSNITCSIGVVRYPSDGRTTDELMIKADVALHHAKNTGKNRYCFFEDSMVEVFNERVQLEGLLADAVRNGDFYLVYQPIVSLHTGEVVSFEALVRLKNHPALPGVFMSIAEECDLSIPMGYWVIQEVLEQLAKWQREGKKPKPVSVNLSAKQFYDANLLDFVVEQLEKTGVDPFYFELEFTEDVLLGDAEKALQIMERMRSLRIALSLDNYGSGYSFISYMTRMPVRYLKVHGTLTENTTENADVMRGLISIAQGLKMEVVAEQVETLAEACALKELGCDYVQGYVFSNPVPHDQAELLFDSDYGDVLVCGGIEEES